MTDQSPNKAFHSSSFLQGHNAVFVEQLYARYAKDPSSVDESWRKYFESLGDDPAAVEAEAAGPSRISMAVGASTSCHFHRRRGLETAERVSRQGPGGTGIAFR